MSLLSVRKASPPPKNPAREALAAAIAEAGPLRKAADDARIAVERARGRLVRAQTAHSMAGSMLAEARSRAVAGITLVEHEPERPSSLRTLRQAEADAADDVAIVAEALANAEGDLDRATYAADRAERRVGEAADTVLYAEIDRHGEAVRELAKVKYSSVAVFEFLMRLHGVHAQQFRDHANFISFHNGTATLDNPAHLVAVATAPWRAAREALLRDPAAALPEIE